MEIIAGTQLPIGAQITIDGQPARFVQDGHTAELVVHIGGQKEVYQPVEYDGDTAKFLLTATDTQELKERKYDGQLAFSVRVYINGDLEQKEVPIHREPLTLTEE